MYIEDLPRKSNVCAIEQSFSNVLNRTYVLCYYDNVSKWDSSLKIEYQHISVQQDRCRQKPTSRELPYARTSKERAINNQYVKAVGETQRVVSRMTDSI